MNEKDDTILMDKFEKRRQAFERISELPSISLPDGYPSIEEMLREDRDKRTDSIISNAQG